MLHPSVELRKINDGIGYGVFATRPLPAGTITWALDPLDQILDFCQVANLPRQLDALLTRYSWANCRGERILCWDFARFMNHSCEANSLSPGGFDFEIAVRPIDAGDQLTSDYGSLNLEEPFLCQCGSSRCRGIVRPGDFLSFAPIWDRQIREAFATVREVEQPLWPWIAEHEGAIDRCLERPETLPSILEHRWIQESLTASAEPIPSNLHHGH